MDNFVWPKPAQINRVTWRGAGLFRLPKPSDRRFVIRSVEALVQAPSKLSDAPAHLAVTIVYPRDQSSKSKLTTEQNVALIVLDRTPKTMLLSASEVCPFVVVVVVVVVVVAILKQVVCL